MNKLLLSSPPLIIIPELAEIVGLNEAVVLQQIHYWVMANSKSGKNYKDGQFWTYNSYPNWQKQFPFWSTRTIKRIFTELETKNLIIVGNFNKLQIDRTKWYRINYEVLETFVNVSGNGGDKLALPWGQVGTMVIDSELWGVVNEKPPSISYFKKHKN